MALYLSINNSNCNIQGLSVEQFAELREILSYKIDAQTSFFSGSFRSNKRYLLNKRCDFPSGLLYLVEDWLKKHRLNHIRKDLRKRPEAILGLHNLKLTLTPYADQLEAVKQALRTNRSIIQMPTGAGKSITAALLIASLNVRTLIVVPNLELKRQLQESFLNYFGTLDNITVENIDSPVLPELTGYDCLIIDEAHHAAAKTYRKLNSKAWAGIYYRYCFTATPYRNREQEQLLMESVTGKVAYSLQYSQAVERGYIVPIEAYYIEVPRSATDAHTWAQVYSKLVTVNHKRNELIGRLLTGLHASGVSTLCLVKEIAHGNKLAALTGGGFANGQGDDKELLISAFNSGKIRTLIGTNGVLGEGVDTKPAEYVIIAGLGKSRPAFMQQVGRGLRRYEGKESAKIILLYDKSHKWTKAHYKTQLKILLDEYGVIPLELKV